MTKDQILEAVTDLYGDRSFSLEEARDNMQAIIEHCEMYADALSDDILAAERRVDG